MLPGGHPAALEPGRAAHVDPVLLEDLDGVAADLRLVVLHVAGGEEHRLAARALQHAAVALGPALEGRAREVRQELVAVDAEHLLEEPAVEADAVHHVREAEARAGQRGELRRLLALQPEPADEQLHGPGLRCERAAALHVADRAHAQTCAFRQFLLRQRNARTVEAQKVPERGAHGSIVAL